MKRIHICVASAVILASTVTGCVDGSPREATGDVTPTLASQPPRYCNIAATPSAGRAPVVADAAAIECFDAYSDAVLAATNRTLWLDPDATPDTFKQLPPDKIAAAATFILAVESIAPNLDTFWGFINVVTQVGSCDTSGFTFEFPDLRAIGFNDVISSAFTFPGCAHGFHFEHPNFGGARLDCDPGSQPCTRNLGALDDRTSSIRWTNNPN